mmetsp:Transcript_70155/g.214951  ORF Transcript_70155/g.214951 Transcript_70155/m.214951 type:complete len:312 (+) Transcript_70155:230-1165(+)
MRFPVRMFSMDLMFSRMRSWSSKISRILALASLCLALCSRFTTSARRISRTFSIISEIAFAACEGVRLQVKDVQFINCSSVILDGKVKLERTTISRHRSWAWRSASTASSPRTPCSSKERDRVVKNFSMLSSVKGRTSRYEPSSQTSNDTSASGSTAMQYRAQPVACLTHRSVVRIAKPPRSARAVCSTYNVGTRRAPQFLMAYCVVTDCTWCKLHATTWPLLTPSCARHISTRRTLLPWAAGGSDFDTDNVVSSPSSISWSSPGIMGVNWHCATNLSPSRMLTEPLANTWSVVFVMCTARFTLTSDVLGS